MLIPVGNVFIPYTLNTLLPALGSTQKHLAYSKTPQLRTC